MGTRALFKFQDTEQSFIVYGQYDNYPKGVHGGIGKLVRALKQSWELPRFEADEFAAAFIAVNKDGAGNLRVTEHKDFYYDGWEEYHYLVTCDGIKVFEVPKADPILQYTWQEAIDYVKPLQEEFDQLQRKIKLQQLAKAWEDRSKHFQFKSTDAETDACLHFMVGAAYLDESLSFLTMQVGIHGASYLDRFRKEVA